MLTREQVLHEMQRYVREAAEPARPGETAKEAMNRAARVLNLKAARVRELWYGRARLVPAEEHEAARAAYVRHREQLKRLYAQKLSELEGGSGG